MDVKWNSLSHVWFFAIPWTIQSMEFSRPEHWSGYPFPSPGDLPNPGIEPRSPPLQVDSLPAEPPGKPKNTGASSLSFSSGSSRPRNWTGVSCIAGGFFYQLRSQGSPYVCEMDYKEDWALKNWCLQIVVLQKTLQSPLNSKEIKPVNPKGNQPWLFIGRTHVEAPILWSPDAKSQFIGKDPDGGKDWGQKEKGVTEDEMVGRHYWLNEHEFE